MKYVLPEALTNDACAQYPSHIDDIMVKVKIKEIMWNLANSNA
ncbi:MAG TPA: hypothetical protein VFM31_09600 [Nitrososphaeraceae archaeon]|nr:hypothetical protein [Nitrososphaeraceae archaeon]